MRQASMSLGVAAVLLSVGLAGCLSGDDPVADHGPHEEEDPWNPWQAGLADYLPTPDVAVNRSADERRANVAPPGDPEFAVFDATIEAWMQAHDIPTATLAIMKDGELRYENGYGYVDQARTEPANASTMMRIASISKPMTAQVIALMVEEGRFDWDDPVFCVPPEPHADCLLPIEPHPQRPVGDSRIADITVAHFRDHTSGWSNGDPDPCNDPIWSSRSVAVADALGAPNPLPRWRVAQWGMGADLTGDPGEPYAYCNGGYIVLSLVAEAVTGATIEAVYDAYLFRPLEVAGDIEFGHSLPEDRNPREPFYSCDEVRGQSVFDPNKTVCWADGGFSVHGLSGAGGLVSTAAAVVATIESLPLDAISLGGARVADYTFSGGLPGTRGMTGVLDTPAGKLQYAFLFNTGEAFDGCPNVQYQGMVPEQPCDPANVGGPLSGELVVWAAAEEAEGAG